MHDSVANTPSISIIVPTHNRARFLQRAVRSALSQTCSDFEILIVDDASSDATPSLARSFADPRIRLFRNEQSRGAAASRNVGLANSRGRFIAFLDDDDEWLPRKLELQQARFAAADANVALIHGGSVVVSESSGRVVDEIVPTANHTSWLDYFGNISFTTSIVLVRRDALVALGGFDESLPGAQDRDLWIRLARQYAFDFVPEVLVRRFIHGDQITSSLPAKIVAKRRIIQKYASDLARHPAHHAHQMWRLGILECVAGEWHAGRASLLAAVRRAPLRRDLWRDLLTALTNGPSACAAKLLQRRLDRVDDVQLYY